MCLGTANLVQRTTYPALRGVGLRPADTPVGARVIGSVKSRPMAIGGSAVWTDTRTRMELETLLARNGLDPDGIPPGSAIDCIPSV